MPEESGKFIAKELVDELRRSRPALTLTQIAGEYGESERNFRRYLKGKPMPLGKGRRFARRLSELHFTAVTRLEELARPHPKAPEAIEFLGKARHAFDTAYATLSGALEQVEHMVLHGRFKKALKRIPSGAGTLGRPSEPSAPPIEHFELDLEHLANLIQTGLAHTY